MDVAAVVVKKANQLLLYVICPFCRLQGADPKVEMQISSLSQRDLSQPVERKGLSGL